MRKAFIAAAFAALATAALGGVAIAQTPPGPGGLSAQQPPAPPPPLSGAVLKLKQGRLQGFVKDGVAVFRALPFAAAPVGDLRWKEPQPAKAWRGVWPAKVAEASCADLSDCPGRWRNWKWNGRKCPVRAIIDRPATLLPMTGSLVTCRS
jgi:hypothetical protein